MPQGAFKKKKGSVATRSKGIRKPTQILRKGGKSIAPKKAKVVEACKQQKAFTRALKEQLEGELSARATHVESKSFKVIQQPQSKSKSKTSRGASDNAMNTETTT